MTSFQRKNLGEALLVWALAMGIIRAFYAFQNVVFISNNLPLLVSGVLIYLPTAVLIYKKEPFDFFEGTWSNFFYSLRITFYTVLVIAPFIFLGNHFLQTYFFHLEYHAAAPQNHFFQKMGDLFLFQIFLVALPEEFFFRGYFLKRLKQVFSLPSAFFLTAFIFSFSHSFIVLRWWHFSIFFPALVFGWLREKTNGLVAPVLFHALCNVFSVWVGTHYR